MAPIYDGSEILLPLSKACGLPIDQVNFIVIEIVALFFGVVFRKPLGPELVSSRTRHAVSLILGVAFGLFCFGKKLFHIVAQTAVCYTCLKLLPASVTHIVVFLLAMGYLIIIHIDRTFFSEPGYTIDISGPLMITTQKVTSLAFGINDGCHRNSEKLTDLQKKTAVKNCPSLLEMSSYIFYFQGLLVGPAVFFSDYKAFIEGTDLVKQVPPTAMTKGKPEPFYVHKPSPLDPVMKKLATVIVWIMIHIFILPHYPAYLNADPGFIANHSFLYRLWYMWLSMTLCKARYYVAWTLGDAVHNASGFGWAGVDRFGRHKWDLVTNIKIMNIETGLSIKDFTDNWNMQTSLWLRHICYERIPIQKVLATFTLSALWHGIYPGYYFTFICSGIFLSAGRQVRRKVRPYFLSSTWLKSVYDVFTWLTTHLVISYVGVAFNLLYWQPILIFYGSVYFFLHVLGTVILAIMPFVPTKEFKMSAQEMASRSSLESSNNNEMVNGKQTEDIHSFILKKHA
ncbi:hypothetical protein CHS0354_025694 [Potamilus streckersoni]|uniref:Uncharacterized protein n=1 Tax=Potamilus streckersoni TaxID=2493646 RepID=A0AAE0S0Y1_9BIVA|nr:hypothetical protein CHS0354_025694 [Potamilus streckersoni]